jgi:hypothetical protein
VTLPDWAPTLSQVAVHIPTRTREADSTTYSGDFAGTFTTGTTPTADQATEQIDQACVKVLGVVGSPVAVEAQDACRVAAAWWAAYFIELGYPERDADVRVYEQLKAEAESATHTAVAMNAAAGGGTSLVPDPGDALLPSHTFPDPPAWADQTFWA